MPDFIVLVDDGRGDDDLLHLVVEIKGYRREDAKEKKDTMRTCWVPGMSANMIEEYPHDKYSPSCLLPGFTRAGRPLHIHVSLADTNFVRIVTLYEPRAAEWIDHARRR